MGAGSRKQGVPTGPVLLLFVTPTELFALRMSNSRLGAAGDEQVVEPQSVKPGVLPAGRPCSARATTHVCAAPAPSSGGGAGDGGGGGGAPPLFPESAGIAPSAGLAGKGRLHKKVLPQGDTCFVTCAFCYLCVC